MRSFWKVLRAFFVMIGVAVVMLAVIGTVSLRRNAPVLPDNIVLTYTFYGTPQDGPVQTGLITRFVPPAPSLAEVTASLYRAARDKRVSAFVARLASGDYQWADVQELQAAIAAFRAAGKKTYVFSESYGDLAPGMAEYYLASAFEEIWLQPVGSVTITGFAAEAPYFKKTLDMIGIAPDIIHKGEYKTAPESALREHMSDAQRQTLHGIMASMMTDFFESVSKNRKIPAARIGQLIDGAPYTPEEAKERKLIDRIGYLDQLSEYLVPPPADDADKSKQPLRKDFVGALDYLDATHDLSFDEIVAKEKKAINKDAVKNDVALVYVTGVIVSDEGQGVPLGEHMAFATDIAGAIDDASLDDEVGAILLRVSSPGGSPSASETIRRAVEVARKRGKYVVVSMGAQAASGGYWISVDADKIFAQTGTLTGSIGVFGGKASFAGLWNKLGVNWDSVRLGANAGMSSSSRPYDDSQRAAISRMLDQTYDGFVDRVAKGRQFAPEIVETMAQGRVWTGRQAKERGLIDNIGGMRQAFEEIAEKLGANSADDLNILVMNDSPGPLQGVLGMLGQGVRMMTSLQSLLAQADVMTGVTRAQSFVFVR